MEERRRKEKKDGKEKWKGKEEGRGDEEREENCSVLIPFLSTPLLKLNSR